MPAVSTEELTVDLGPRSYTIVVGAGVLDDLGARLAGLGFRGRCAVVTSDRVGALYRKPADRSLRLAGKCRKSWMKRRTRGTDTRAWRRASRSGSTDPPFLARDNSWLRSSTLCSSAQHGLAFRTEVRAKIRRMTGPVIVAEYRDLTPLLAGRSHVENRIRAVVDGTAATMFGLRSKESALLLQG